MDSIIKTIEPARCGKCALAVSAAVVCLVLTYSCTDSPSTTADTSAGPVTLTIGYPHVTGQDPLYGMQQGARLVSHEGLVLPNRNGRIQARLAESWREAPDGLSWHFTLRSNASFHDGSVVSSTAVKESLQRSLASADIDSFPGLADIVAVEAPSSTELVLRLRSRSAFLLDDLGVAIQKTQPGRGSIGTGPFMTSSVSQTEVVMTAFPKYYRGAPKIDRIVWRAYPAVRSAWAAMMRGDLDVLYEVGPQALEFMQGGASVDVYPFLRSYLFGAILNSRRATFSDWRVRRALNYAIDRTEVVAGPLNGRGIPAAGIAWPQHWAYDPSLPSFSYDPSKATALLDAAGVERVRTHERGRPPSRLHFSCLVPEGFALWEHMALMVQRNLTKIGVDMTLESVPFETFNHRIASSQFDAVLMEFVVGSSPSRPFTFWYSKSRRNLWGYESPNMDRALDGIRRASSEGEYRESFRQFQVEGLDDPPAIFLALGENARAVSRRFQVVAPPGSDILPTIADWQPAEVARASE